MNYKKIITFGWNVRRTGLFAIFVSKVARHATELVRSRKWIFLPYLFGIKIPTAIGMHELVTNVTSSDTLGFVVVRIILHLRRDENVSTSTHWTSRTGEL